MHWQDDFTGSVTYINTLIRNENDNEALKRKLQSDKTWIYCKHCNERTISIKGICLECQRKGLK